MMQQPIRFPSGPSVRGRVLLGAACTAVLLLLLAVEAAAGPLSPVTFLIYAGITALAAYPLARTQFPDRRICASFLVAFALSVLAVSRTPSVTEPFLAEWEQVKVGMTVNEVDAAMQHRPRYGAGVLGEEFTGTLAYETGRQDDIAFGAVTFIEGRVAEKSLVWE